MKGMGVAVLALLVFTPAAVACSSIYTQVSIYLDGTASPQGVDSNADVSCVDYFGNPWVSFLSIQHWIDDDHGRQGTQYSSGYLAEWHGFTFTTTSTPDCYRGGVSATDGSISQGAGSSQLCLQGPPAPTRCSISEYANMDGALYFLRTSTYDCRTRITLTAATPANYEFTGWSGEISSQEQSISFDLTHDMTETANFRYSASPPDNDPVNHLNDGDPPCQNCHCPIVINLGNGRYQLSGTSDPVWFDIDASGRRERLAWTAVGAPMAFLALDRNGNGQIDDGSELFGNHTPFEAGGVARNGFEALRQYDANGDGMVSASDPIWSSLLLWTDLNHDGISEPPEIVPLSATSVGAIDVAYHWTGARDPSGNLFRYESKIWMKNRIGQVVPRPVYDVFFLAAR